MLVHQATTPVEDCLKRSTPRAPSDAVRVASPGESRGNSDSAAEVTSERIFHEDIPCTHLHHLPNFTQFSVHYIVKNSPADVDMKC